MTATTTPTGSKAGADLEAGDVIAVPFAGYGDLLANVTAAERRGDLMDVTVSEPKGFAYTTVVPARDHIATYAAGAAGTWNR